MGMFDHISCEYPLPLTEETKALSPNWGQESGFQTKDLDNSLSYYRISPEGELLKEELEHEYIPYTEEELKGIRPKPWSPFKEVIVKNRYFKKVEHHGEVTFYSSFEYTDNEDYWLEFKAYFIYGKLDKISLVSAEKIVSQKLANETWDIKRKEEESKLWFKFKRLVSPYGWRLFWIKTSKLCGYVARKLNNLEHAIYRNMM
jgi:hypothetical protein